MDPRVIPVLIIFTAIVGLVAYFPEKIISLFHWLKGSRDLYVLRDGKVCKWDMSIGIDPQELQIEIVQMLFWRWAKIRNNFGRWKISSVSKDALEGNPKVYLYDIGGQSLNTAFLVLGASMSLPDVADQLKEVWQWNTELKNRADELEAENARFLQVRANLDRQNISDVQRIGQMSIELRNTTDQLLETKAIIMAISEIMEDDKQHYRGPVAGRLRECFNKFFEWQAAQPELNIPSRALVLSWCDTLVSHMSDKV